MINLAFLSPPVTLEPAAESLVVCPGGTANYVCTDESAVVAINWQICCRRILSDSCSPETQESITARNLRNNRTHCGILFTYGYAQGVSSMNITIPLTGNTTLLEITCHINIRRRVLRVAGEMKWLIIVSFTYTPFKKLHHQFPRTSAMLLTIVLSMIALSW